MDNQHRKIAGYRELDAIEIEAMNALKSLEANLGTQLVNLEEHVTELGDHEAKRWIDIARTYLETGMMYAIKAVARPTNGLGRKDPG